MPLEWPYDVPNYRDRVDIYYAEDQNRQDRQIAKLTERVNRVWADDAHRPTPSTSDCYPFGFNYYRNTHEAWNGTSWVAVPSVEHVNYAVLGPTATAEEVNAALVSPLYRGVLLLPGTYPVYTTDITIPAGKILSAYTSDWTTVLRLDGTAKIDAIGKLEGIKIELQAGFSRGQTVSDGVVIGTSACVSDVMVDGGATLGQYFAFWGSFSELKHCNAKDCGIVSLQTNASRDRGTPEISHLYNYLSPGFTGTWVGWWAAFEINDTTSGYHAHDLEFKDMPGNYPIMVYGSSDVKVHDVSIENCDYGFWIESNIDSDFRALTFDTAATPTEWVDAVWAKDNYNCKFDNINAKGATGWAYWERNEFCNVSNVNCKNFLDTIGYGEGFVTWRNWHCNFDNIVVQECTGYGCVWQEDDDNCNFANINIYSYELSYAGFFGGRGESCNYHQINTHECDQYGVIIENGWDHMISNIQANETGSSNGCQAGIYIDVDDSNISFLRVAFTESVWPYDPVNYPAHGIWVIGNYTPVNNLNIVVTQGDGIRLEIYDGTVSDCFADLADKKGVHVYNSRDCTFSNLNSRQSNEDGIMCDGNRDCSFTNLKGYDVFPGGTMPGIYPAGVHIKNDENGIYTNLHGSYVGRYHSFYGPPGWPGYGIKAGEGCVHTSIFGANAHHNDITTAGGTLPCTGIELIDPGVGNDCFLNGAMMHSNDNNYNLGANWVFTNFQSL